MQFMTQLTTLFFAFIAVFATLSAAIPVKPRDVFVPKITSPTKDTVWTHGQKYNVTWDTSDAPEHISNGFSVQLRYNNLIQRVILAKGFDPRQGWVEITAPWVVPGNDYGIVLFGDSGNWSENFTIN